MSEKFYPLKFDPVLKDYVWGGRHLATELGRDLPPGDIAESWEIAAHPDGTATVRNGRFAGQSLTAVHAELGLDLIGGHNRWAQERDKFPLLIKLLDANRNLSVQVHPDDAYALEHEGDELGKSEMWVVLYAEPEAAVILGVKEGTTPQAFRQAIADGELEKYLHTVPIQAGDVVCVPSRTLHAILAGSILAEIQQNSNVTYRVYDWDRKVDGQSRPLHVEQAMDVINFDQVEPGLAQPRPVEAGDTLKRWVLCQNDYFRTERVELAPGAAFNGRCDGSSLEIWGCIQGDALVNHVGLTAVEFTLLPAALGDFTVTAGDAGATLLRTYVP